MGIWVLGPVWMTLNASFAGGGFSQAMTWQSLAVPLRCFPFTTLMMATYDGSLLALGLTVLVLPAVAMLIQDS